MEGDRSFIPLVFISLWRTNRRTVDKHLCQRWEIFHRRLAPHVNLLTYIVVAPQLLHFHSNDPRSPCRFLSCLLLRFSKLLFFFFSNSNMMAKAMISRCLNQCQHVRPCSLPFTSVRCYFSTSWVKMSSSPSCLSLWHTASSRESVLVIVGLP